MMITPKKIYTKLMKAYGPQGWWPTTRWGYHHGNVNRELKESECLEICVGAILTQNTSWTNVAMALDQLLPPRPLSLSYLNKLTKTELARKIVSAGYYNQKTEYLKTFSSHVHKQYGSCRRMFERELPPLRKELLSLKGIGPETADSMLLFAGRKETFVIDAYTKRISFRLGLCEEEVKYDVLKSLFETSLPKDQAVYNEFHALFVETAKRCCKRSNPDCQVCPLRQSCTLRKNG